MHNRSCKRIAAFALLGLLSWPLIPRPAVAATLEYVDSAQWTFPNDCSARNDTIVTTLAYGLQIWDATTPANPVMLSDWYFAGEKGISVDVSDHVVAATDATGRLKVFDISDPQNPTLANELTGFGINADVAFQKRGGTRYCFVAGSSGLRVVNIDNPFRPEVIDELNLAGDPRSLSFFGDSLVVLSDNFGIQVVDASDPSNLSLIGSKAIDLNRMYNVTTNGEIAVVVTREDGFLVYDLSDPTAPDSLTQLTIPISGDNVYVFKDGILNGDLLYLAVEISGNPAGTAEGINVFDLSTPTSPQYVGDDADVYETFSDMHYADGKVYATQWSSNSKGVHIIDVSNPANPHSIGHTLAWDFSRFAAVEQDRVYTAMGHTGAWVHTFNETDGFAFYYGGYFALNSWAVLAQNGIVHIASADDGYLIVDWDTSDDGTLIGQVVPGTCRAVRVIGDKAYLAVYRTGLVTVDISNPADPTVLDESEPLPDDPPGTPQAHEAIALDIQGNLVAVAERVQGLQLSQVDSQGNISLLGSFKAAGRVLDVKLNGDLAYLCCEDSRLRVLDISDPANPSELLAIVAGQPRGCWIDGDYLHVAAGGTGLITFSITDPDSPVEVCRYNSTGDAMAVTVRDNIVFVSDYSGLLALSFSPDTPVAVSSFALAWTGSAVEVDWLLGEPAEAENLRLVAAPATGGAEAEIDIAAQGAGGRAWQGFDSRAVLVPGSEWRYTLHGRDPGADWELLRSETIVIGDAPLAAVALRAFPNPFNPSTRLDFVLPTAGPARLAVYDVTGRRLALLHEGRLPAGPAVFEWDGRDGEGSAMASGVYLARLELAGLTRQVKLVLLR